MPETEKPLITRLNHIAMRTANTTVMRNFYSKVLGLDIDRRRPDHFSGFHLRSMVPSGEPIVHVMTGRDAEINDGSVPTESGAIHHLAFYCQGFEDTRAALVRYGIPWREYRIPEAGLWQIFVFDPHGVLIELSFESAVEGIAEPAIPAGMGLDPRDRSWFEVSRYKVFEEAAMA